MRTGLVTALAVTDTQDLRANAQLAGRSVLGWQVALLHGLGAKRILCLCNDASREVLRLQHDVEASGAAFHAISSLAAVAALVRDDDELIVVCDGLVPDAVVVRALLTAQVAPQTELPPQLAPPQLAPPQVKLQKTIVCLPSNHALAARYPVDFERIDGQRNWAGVLLMSGGPVQQLADFSDDADAVSVLLRLALQARTPFRDLAIETTTPGTLTQNRWFLADSAVAVADHQEALIKAALNPPEWRAPMIALATLLVGSVAPRGLARGALFGAGAAFVFLLSGAFAAAMGWAAIGLMLAAAGAMAGTVGAAFNALACQLNLGNGKSHKGALIAAIDGCAALTVWFALSPWPQWTPLAVCGPLTIGLARLAQRKSGDTLALIAADRASLLLLFTLAAWFALLPEMTALITAGLLAGLLLRKGAD